MKALKHMEIDLNCIFFTLQFSEGISSTIVNVSHPRLKQTHAFMQSKR